MHETTVWDHVLAVLVGLVLPLQGALRHRNFEVPEETFTTQDKVVLYWSNSTVLAVLAGVTAVVGHLGGRTFTSLGFSAPRELGTGLGMAALFLAIYTADTLFRLSPRRLPETRRRWRRDTPFMPANPREVGHSLVMVASASLFEEIIFRGFLVAYVAHFTGTTPLGLAAAVALPGAVFALCHVYQGWHAVAKIAVLAGLFGAILVVTGSLWIPIALHFVVDLVGVLLGPRLLRTE